MIPWHISEGFGIDIERLKFALPHSVDQDSISVAQPVPTWVNGYDTVMSMTLTHSGLELTGWF